jgi:phosphate:Na+ symporter
MENIADLLSRDLSHQAGKLVERGAEFSPDGRRELEAVFDEVGRSFDQTLGVLAQAGRPAADEVRRRDREMEARWCDLSARHFARLTQQVPETAGTDEIHMDVVTTLRQAHSLLAASVEALTDPRAGAPATSPAADKA